MASRRAAGPSFTAIDFETANRLCNSACAVGAVQVRDGRVVERAYELIRPPFRLLLAKIHHLRDLLGKPPIRSLRLETPAAPPVTYDAEEEVE